MLNTIAFSVGPANDFYDDSIVIRIDGVDLLEMVGEYEATIARGDDRDIVGGYLGIPSFACDPQTQRFDPTEHKTEHRTDIYWCRDCGIAGCWPLRTRISIDDDTVTWSDFCQPYRDGTNGATLWSYQAFGPFRFSAPDYFSALTSLAKTGGGHDIHRRTRAERFGSG